MHHYSELSVDLQVPDENEESEERLKGSRVRTGFTKPRSNFAPELQPDWDQDVEACCVLFDGAPGYYPGPHGL